MAFSSTAPASVEAKIVNVITEALQAASCAIEGSPSDSSEGQWKQVSSDSLAASCFLKFVSNALGFELPDILLQCKKLQDVIDEVSECAARAKAVTRNNIPFSKVHVEQKAPRVAIVSASCRLPGGADTLGELWADILFPGEDVIKPIPITRWNADLLYDPEGCEGTSYVKEGGFLETADVFDNRFFEIPDHEVSAHRSLTLTYQG